MDGSPGLITIGIAILTVFLLVITSLKYVIEDAFTRTRLIMTLFALFISGTMTITFWGHIRSSVPFMFVSIMVGVILGRFLAVEAAEKKLTMQGLQYYMEHIAHIHIHDFKKLTWWSFANFYTVIGALFCINLIGLSTVIFKTPAFATATLSFGSLLIGTLLPYLAHLWSLSIKNQSQK